MSIDELVDRLRYRFNDYWHSEKRSVKLISRALALTLFAAVVSTIAPTLADELSSDPAMLEPVSQSSPSTTTVTTSETPTASPSATPTFTPEPIVSRPAIATPTESPFVESSDTATADMPGVPLETQTAYIVKAPSTIAVDPRALNRFAPHIYVANPNPEIRYTMVCISGAGLRFDVKQKGAAHNQIEGDELITGDLSGLVLVSAETARAIELVNSYQGLFISSTGGGISGRSLTFRFLAVSKPVVDPSYCGAARSGAITTIRPLGLDQSTVKGGGRLK
jgi:hypothetical protein